MPSTHLGPYTLLTLGAVERGSDTSPSAGLEGTRTQPGRARQPRSVSSITDTGSLVDGSLDDFRPFRYLPVLSFNL